MSPLVSTPPRESKKMPSRSEAILEPSITGRGEVPGQKRPLPVSRKSLLETTNLKDTNVKVEDMSLETPPPSPGPCSGGGVCNLNPGDDTSVEQKAVSKESVGVQPKTDVAMNGLHLNLGARSLDEKPASPVRAQLPGASQQPVLTKEEAATAQTTELSTALRVEPQPDGPCPGGGVCFLPHTGGSSATHLKAVAETTNLKELNAKVEDVSLESKENQTPQVVLSAAPEPDAPCPGGGVCFFKAPTSEKKEKIA